MADKKYTIDMTDGPILKKLVRYSLPIAVINVMTLLFNTTNITILGMFVGDDAVAAVGATTALITLITSIFNGLSSGVNVVVARYVGAKDMAASRRAVGTACTLGLLSGIILMIITNLGARTFLTWMKCDPAVIDMSTRYLKIYFMGMPVIMLYNFIAASLRATGDSARPMRFMLIAGVIHVVLNIIFITVFKLTVEGTAIATVLSQSVALALAIRLLLKNKDYCKVEKQNLRIFKVELLNMIKYGLTGGIAGVFFYVANVVIQTAVNTLGVEAMTANAVASQFDAFIYNIGCAVATACMVFVGQNIGAKKIDRIKDIILTSSITATALSLFTGVIFIMLSDVLCGLVTDDPRVIEIAKQRMILLCSTYFTASVMEVFGFSLRAMGWYKTIIAVACFVGLISRDLWVNFLWPLNKTLGMLYLSYPVTCTIAILVYIVVFAKAMKKMKKEYQEI